VEASIDFNDLHKAAEKMGLTEQDLNNIIRLAMDDTAKWANKQAAKRLGHTLKVPYPAMRKRVKAKKSGQGRDAKVWFGLNEISLRYLKPKEDSSGVTTTAKSVPGAFIGGYKLGLGVFKRTGEKREMKSGRYKGKKREVIEKQTLSIVGEAEAVLSTIVTEEVNDYYLERIVHYFGRHAGPNAEPLNLK